MHTNEDLGELRQPIDKILRRVRLSDSDYGWLETCAQHYKTPAILSSAIRRGLGESPMTEAAAAAVFVMADLRSRMPEWLRCIQDAKTQQERESRINALLDRIGADPLPAAGGSGCSVSVGQVVQIG